MDWFLPEGLYALLMIGVFAFCAFAWKLPIAVAMVAAALAGSLAAGIGVPLRHLVEGQFGYINTILVISSAQFGHDFHEGGAARGAA